MKIPENVVDKIESQMLIYGGLVVDHSIKGVGKDNRYLEDKTPYGRKVIFLDRYGTVGDRLHANHYMSKGDVVTVSEIYVGYDYESTVVFQEFRDIEFNTIMFADVHKEIPIHPYYRVYHKGYYCICGVIITDWESKPTNYCSNCGQKLIDVENENSI